MCGRLFCPNPDLWFLLKRGRSGHVGRTSSQQPDSSGDRQQASEVVGDPGPGLLLLLTAGIRACRGGAATPRDGREGRVDFRAPRKTFFVKPTLHIRDLRGQSRGLQNSPRLLLCPRFQGADLRRVQVPAPGHTGGAHQRHAASRNPGDDQQVHDGPHPHLGEAVSTPRASGAAATGHVAGVWVCKRVKCFLYSFLKSQLWGTRLAQLVERGTLDLGVVSSSPMLDVEKKKS